MSLFRHSRWFSFSVKQFPLQCLECVTQSYIKLIRTAEELSYRAVFFAENIRKVKVASRYRAFSSSYDLSITGRIVLNFNFDFKVLTDRNKRSEML